MSVARINNERAERLSNPQTAHNTPIVYTMIRYPVDALHVRERGSGGGEGVYVDERRADQQ
jgi:hypothetical protein